VKKIEAKAVTVVICDTYSVTVNQD